MSGTSMDGIDIAVLTTDGESHVERGPGAFLAYDSAFRKKIENALDEAKSLTSRAPRRGALAALEQEITLRHAQAVKGFLAANPQLCVDVIGFHGQTVLHRPDLGFTIQLGDGDLLARESGFPVVYDMRANDMAHGGQGAPLVPVYHAALASSLPQNLRQFPMCFVNIGGISNVTFVPEHGHPVAFDSGPGNALIDQWVSRDGQFSYDEDGRLAAKGRIVESVVQAYLDAPFFAKTAPKSLDRNDFTLNHVEGLDLADGARTLAAVSARAIRAASSQMPEEPKLWILCGGGRKNPHIVHDMQQGMSSARVILAEDAMLDGDAMEAEAWAYLAARSLKGLPLTFPATTGCREPVSGGVLANP